MKKRVLYALILAGILASTTGCGDIEEQVENAVDLYDEHVLAVKNGYSLSYPNITYEAAFESFFSSPTWNYFTGVQEGPDDDGDGKPDYTIDGVDVVEFTGYCTYRNVEVKALLQFVLSKEDDTFEAVYLSFNDIPQSTFIMESLLKSVFEEAENSAKKTQKSDENAMPTETDGASENPVSDKLQDEPTKTPQVIQLDYRYIKNIQASSELTDSTKTYKAEAMLDGNKETCWSEGAAGTGEGESVNIEFTCPVYISEVRFLNGYMKNETVYNANGKIKRAKLDLDGALYEVEFDDWQYGEIENEPYSDRFTLDAPVRAQSLTITISDAQQGTKYDDICLTELDIWGYADDADISDSTLPAGSYVWTEGSNEDARGADIAVSYEDGGRARLTGECWNSVASAKIDAVAVSVDTDGSVQFIGNGICSAFDEEKQVSNIVLKVLATQQNEIRITQDGETGSAEFAGTYQAAGEETFDIFDRYGDVIYEVALMYGSDCEYALYDMDHDGTVELITSQGTCNADWSNTVYTIDNSGMLVEVGTFYGVVSLYAAENGNGIYSVYGHMDYQEVEWITKNGNALNTETILSGETVEYYENDNPIPMAGVDEDIKDY